MSLVETIRTIKSEHIVNVKELQKSPSRSLRGITRILRGKKSLGLFISEETINDFLEDLEAASSTTYLASIRTARREAKNRKNITLDTLKKRYGI